MATTYEVKNVKIHKDMSEETLCFSAAIYADGKRIGTAKNQGQGGPNHYEADDDEAFKALEAFAKERGTVEEKFSFMETDIFIDELVNEFDWNRILRRDCKTKTLFRTSDEPNKDSWRVIKAKFSDEIRSYIYSKYGTDAIILNETI